MTPYIWDDFMTEHRHNTAFIDDEYAGVFNGLVGSVLNEVEQKRQAAKVGRELDQITAAKLDRETTISIIEAKEREYQSQVESAHSLYGHNPFFLMKELPFRKIVDGVNSVPADLLGAYSAIDRAYRSALELKRISLENNALANQLADLAKKTSQAEIASQPDRDRMTSWLVERLYSVNREKDIRLQLLANFLQGEVVSGTGAVEGLNYSQSLEKYKATIDAVVAREQAAVGSFSTANPHIQSPLSKPEHEALKNLVGLQANTDLGKRWEDYHISLLHSENARILTEASNAFGELIARAKEAEGLLEQARLAAEAEARRVADEQIRLAAETEARRLADEQARLEAEAEARRFADEQARLAAEADAEAKRVAHEQARISAEEEAQREAAEVEAKAAQAEEAAYKRAVSFLADTNKHILEKYGANLAKTAQGLQSNISGKNIRSYKEALASFEKVSANPGLKLNAKDTRAVVEALNALDNATFADNVNRLGKAFGVVGRIVQAEAIREKIVFGVETGDWKPLGLEVEAIAVGTLAASAVGVLAAIAFAFLTVSPILSVTLVALLMAGIASYIDADRVDEINGYFCKLMVCSR